MRAGGGWAGAFTARWCLVAMVSLALFAAAMVTARGSSAHTRASLDAGPRGLHVIPFPGTPDASRDSDVIFSSLSPSQLRSVTVRGSRSGLHGGHVVRLPDGAGSAFVPVHGFASGETVSVQARLSSPAAGTASGARDATRLAFSFATASLTGGSFAAVPAAGDASGGTSRKTTGHPGGAAATMPPDTRSFVSAPGIHPPMVYATSDPDTRSGDIFLTTRHSFQNGTMILDARGRLRWFLPSGTDLVNDLEVQRYEGRPVLTWSQRRKEVIADSDYHTIATLHPGEDYHTYRHEFQLTPQGTAYVEAWVPAPEDLTSVGGPAKGIVEDAVIQELDVKTGAVLWEWHSLDHVPVSASYSPAPPAGHKYSYFHLNSIQPLPGNRLLISARDTWALYMIDERTGDVIWRMGGKHSSFTMGPGTNFEWQHDARLQSNGLLTVFDDGATPTEESQSSAKVLKLDPATHSVSLVHKYTHTPPLLAAAAGSMQMLPNGNVFVGWGNNHEFSEYTAAGAQIFNGQFPLAVYSYRAFRFPWIGHPLTPPSLAVSQLGHGSLRIYASWNGDTEVQAWRVLTGSSRKALKPYVKHRWSDFETTITLHAEPRYVAVQALGAGGGVLGTSKVHATHG